MSNNTVETMRSRIQRRIAIKSIVLILWAAGMLYIALLGEGELAQNQYLYMAFACLAVWAISTVRDVRRLCDEDMLRKAAIEESDERNTLIAYKATRLATTIVACLFPVAIIVLAFLGMQETIDTLAYTMCVFLVAYLASWYYVANNN